MINNQWYVILDSKEIKKQKPFGVTRFGKKMVLWRTRENKLCCIADKCCHRGASLSVGRVSHDEITCPFHGFRYDFSGKVIEIPANGKNTEVSERYHVKSYQVEERDGFIWLWYGDQKENIPPIASFELLTNGFSYGGFSEVWPVHYSRAIENQLDVVHLPFVHGNSIGKGNNTIVNGPVVKWEDNRMTFYVDNHKDHGQRPLRAKEIINYEKLFSLQFQMPNLWQNRISDDIRIVAGFAPIDNEHTRIYLRFYQRFIKIPGLKQLINQGSKLSNRYILHQDRRVVLTQQPIKTELKMSENLIQGDAPIIEYRKRRALLKKEI